MVNSSRDQTYYFADGNTVILAEDTLFRVHRTVLSREGTVFDGLFTIHDHFVGDVSSAELLRREGESDDNPIRMEGDSSDEVKALLWSLYALYVPSVCPFIATTTYNTTDHMRYNSR
jgi:hypothetical protein